MTQFDLSNPDKVPFAKMPQWAQWAMGGALADGADVEYFAQGKWRKHLSANILLQASVYRIRPEPVRETVEHEAFVWEFINENFAMVCHSRPPRATKGTATVTTEDGKPVKLVWEAKA